MRIVIETIPHENQEYNTVGNWRWDKSDLTIQVSEMHDSRFEWLVAIHELVEALLCMLAGITTQEVTNFDLAHNDVLPISEPGDAVDCPYQLQHCVATGIERTLAAIMRVNWSTYEDTIDNLIETYPIEKEN